MKKQLKHEPYSYKLLELFGGIGAPRKALDNLYADCKIKSVDYVDILNWAVTAYSLMSPNCYLPQSVTQWNLDVDILFHGSPCQDFSNAGNNKGGEKGSGTRSSLLWETIDIVKNRLNKLPKIIIWENVKGVLYSKHINTFNKYIDELQVLGYESQWEILNAKDFGIPQNRARVFVVSIHESCASEFAHFNIKNLPKKPMRPLHEFLESQVNYRYFLDMHGETEHLEFGKFITLPRGTDGKLINGSYNRYWKIDNNECYVGTLPVSNQIKIIVPKYDDNLPIIKLQDKEFHVRFLTERECWRLMGFTDNDYDKIDKVLPSSAKYELAGNSIVVDVLEVLFENLLWVKK